MEAYIGIDVSCAKKKRCPISICVKKEGKLVPLLLERVDLCGIESKQQMGWL